MIALSFRGDIAAREHRVMLEAALDRDAPTAKSMLEKHVGGGVEHALATGTIKT
jgi:DNA-binding GntR family transcriptional regulator